MRLLNVDTVEYEVRKTEPYVILSHTWGDEEIAYEELGLDNITEKAGYQKILRACAQAKKQGYQYIWIDTCCIDKRSSAELTEAINSMYKWYSNATLCIIYLADVPGFQQDDNMSASQGNAFKKSAWFTRGWTLQELIACRHRIFFSQDWSIISDKEILEDAINVCAKVTDIPKEVLQHNRRLQTICIAQRMSWAAQRQTTRPEDRAYSLMGIFGVNMPILYGEGLRKAFRRLQDEIMKSSFDQTLFAWRGNYETSGLLAHTPDDFQHTPEFELWAPQMLMPYQMTNIGISIRPYLFQNATNFLTGVIPAALQVDMKTDEGWSVLFIRIQQVPKVTCNVNGEDFGAWRRVECDTWEIIPGQNLGDPMNLVVLEDEHSDLLTNTIDMDKRRRTENVWATTSRSFSLKLR
jgi:hypothetical protein